MEGTIKRPDIPKAYSRRNDKEKKRDVRKELRKCRVKNGDKEQRAWFHGWVEIANVIEPSLIFGGRNGGQNKYTVGLVEYTDGTVEEVAPYRVVFRTW